MLESVKLRNHYINAEQGNILILSTKHVVVSLSVSKILKKIRLNRLINLFLFHTFFQQPTCDRKGDECANNIKIPYCEIECEGCSIAFTLFFVKFIFLGMFSDVTITKVEKTDDFEWINFRETMLQYESYKNNFHDSVPFPFNSMKGFNFNLKI